MTNFDEYQNYCGVKIDSFSKNEIKKKYTENCNFIAKHNSKFEKGQKTYRVSDKCCLAHLDRQTITNQRCGFKIPKTTSSQTSDTPQSTQDLKLMSLSTTSTSNCDISNCNNSVDWRFMRVIPSVKDQKTCGSCWAFTAVDTVDTMYAYKKWKSGQPTTFYKFSPQQLVDCWGSCSGSIYTSAWRKWMNCTGVAPLSQYPYISADGVCKDTSSMSCTPMKNYFLLPSGDESCMVKHLNDYPCIAVAMDASQSGFQMYSSGIYSDPDCSSTVVNHAVIITGYGTENGMDYWIIRNSWGSNWGENGFFRMERGCNMCGVAYFPACPTVS